MPNGSPPHRPDQPDDAGNHASYGWLYEGSRRSRPSRDRSRARRAEAEPPESTRVMPTRPGQGPAGPPPGGAGYPQSDQYGNDQGSGSWPDDGAADYPTRPQSVYPGSRDPRSGYDRDDDYPPPRTGRPSEPPPRVPPGGRLLPPPRSPRRRSRIRWGRIVLLLVLAWLVVLVGVPVLAWSRVDKVAYEPTGTRPQNGSGSNFLLVGSDSREGLTPEQRNDFGTGSASGQRTDTIMILHVPSLGGSPTLVSIPRDSYVPIPGHGRNKINAAFSLGGPQLLAATVENTTGLLMDGYVEIGFGGFVNVVDGLGGVNMCLPKAIEDEKAHIDLAAGCQDLDGPNALGYVRARYSDPKGDLGRVERQRQFLSAVMKKSISPATIINPVRYTRVGLATGDAITVGEGTTIVDMARFGLAMRSVSSGSGSTLTVPISDPDVSTPVGSAVRWDSPKALQLFHALRDGDPIPPSLIPAD
ncbi:LCP family protein [Actinopolymorpha pittospori]